MIWNLVNSLLGKLADAAFKKVRQIQEVGDKVDRLTRELQRLQAIVKDADQKKITTQSEKLWVKELINVAWDIEDVLDNALLLEVAPQGETSDTEGSLRMFKKPRNLPALDKLSDEINRILARIDEIFKSRERYGIHNLGEASGEETMLPLKPHVIPDIDDPNVIDFEAHKEIIVEALLDQNTKRRSVVSIVGIGGIGKTTLARKVYNCSTVKESFDHRIWVVVSQNFELIDIVRKILQEIGTIDSSGQRNDVQYFLTKLYRSLEGKKYLIVLDDVWAEGLWHHIEEALADSNNGSRVLMTSRNKNVANTADPSLAPYEVPLLSEEDSLQLLLKKAQYDPDLTNDSYSHHLLGIARKLVKKCDGLPLALVVLGGLLSRYRPEYIVWSNFLQTMSWSTDGSRCSHILATSYDDLPLALKFCFMYFAAFPEDYIIVADQLIRMWVAEGLIPQEGNNSLEDTASKFLNELAQRSLVEVSEEPSEPSDFLTITYCQVHDLLRDLAVEKAKEINFLTVCYEEHKCREARRVAVHYFDCGGLMNYANPNLRTLLCFNFPLPNCSGHKLLKVLSDMGDKPIERGTEPNYIEGLSQLRYLKITPNEDHNSCFGKFINNMKFLQTLDLGAYRTFKRLPDFMWGIESLRHFIGSGCFGPPSGSNLRNLKTLTGIIKYRESWETTTVPNMPNLLILQIHIFDCSSKVVAALLNTLKSLVHLDLLLPGNIPLDVLDMKGFPFYQQLTSLKLNGEIYYGEGVAIDATMFPIHLTKLHLEDCKIRQDLMEILEKLYNLKDLCIFNGMDECIKAIRCSARGFPRLLSLDMWELKNLEEWEIEKGAMPKLQSLNIIVCPMLRVPLGLQCLTALRELYWSLYSDQSSATKEEEIRNLCSHVPHLVI